MNDCEAVGSCILENQGLGFIIALGKAIYNDDNQSFKFLHTRLKGGQSKYEKERIKRGAPSRKRKTSFELIKYLVIFSQNMEKIEQALDENWMAYAQKGWRNADGSLRRAKYRINIDTVSIWAHKSDPNLNTPF